MGNTQRELVKKHLNKFGKITSMTAIMEYGCTRLSSVIYDLRKEGMKILTEFTTRKNRYGNKVVFATYKRVR